ncbi:hypothetical protein ACSSS7_003591 [Eimeria intestinalis]
MERGALRICRFQQQVGEWHERRVMETEVECFIDCPRFGLDPREATPSNSEGGPFLVAERLKIGRGGAEAPLSPTARGGHTATRYEGKVYVFGGHELRGAEKGFIYHNELHVLDIKERRWVKVSKQTGTPPAPRYGHSACLLGSRIIFFGGKGGPNSYFQDLHALDVETLTWYRGPSRPTDPPPRFWHSSNIKDSLMIVFGGVAGNRILGDLHSLDLQRMQWKQLTPRGKAPKPRFGHASILLEDFLIIHGGMAKLGLEGEETDASLVRKEDLENWYLNDLHALSLRENTWHRVRVRGATPFPRFGHSINKLGNSLLLFGGWPHASPSAAPRLMPNSKQQDTASATTDTAKNPEAAPAPAAPTAPAAAAAASGTEIAAAGKSAGAAPTAAAEAAEAAAAAAGDGVHEIPFAVSAALCSYTGEWGPVFVRGPPLAARHGHSCTETEEGLIILGGWVTPLSLMEVLLLRMQPQAAKD